MLSKLSNTVGKIALTSTSLSFVITVSMINLVSETPGHLNTAELFGILISMVVPILVSVPMSHFVLSQNKKLELLAEKLRIAQRMDEMTGLLRRSAFYQDVETKLRNSEGQVTEHALFFIDLDDFKNINDVHGHQTGDNTLRVFGEVVSETMDDDDIAGRLGGEEFALFSYNRNADEAAELAQVLTNRFQQRACVVDGKHIKATISVGICISSGNEDLEALMRKADGRMYQAKANGKNQFVLNEFDLYQTDLAA